MGCSAKKLKKKRQQKKSLLPCPWGGGTHCRGRCIVFGQWRFYFLFFFSFFAVSSLDLLLHPHSLALRFTRFSALRLFRAVALPPASHTNLQSCCRFCGYLRCNVATSRRVFLHSTNRVSAMVSTATPSPASSKCPSELGPSGRVWHSNQSRSHRPMPCHTKIACT